jgi:hypothetical protein
MHLRQALLAALIPVLSSCAAATQTGTAASMSSNPLIGTWELVSSRMTRGDSVLGDYRAPALQSTKILNATHFSFLTRRGTGEFARAAVGRYTVVGNQYTEMIEASSATSITNKSYTFTYRIDGDLWHHTGRVEDADFDEVWRRVR